MILTQFLTPLLALALASLPAQGQQIVYDAIHNATGISGTWSSGSKAVLTGAVRGPYHMLNPVVANHVAGFCESSEPIIQLPQDHWSIVFIVSANDLDSAQALMRLASTDDGFYEIARYRFNGNGAICLS